ncbi:MAG: hypothetical protein EXS36_16005 [Pedosphaera sp.]|nr:hypothetical protein [Pedosphaera sp.]
MSELNFRIEHIGLAATKPVDLRNWLSKSWEQRKYGPTLKTLPHFSSGYQEATSWRSTLRLVPYLRPVTINWLIAERQKNFLSIHEKSLSDLQIHTYLPPAAGKWPTDERLFGKKTDSPDAILFRRMAMIRLFEEKLLLLFDEGVLNNCGASKEMPINNCRLP